MTVPSNKTREDYVGDGATTEWDYTFKIFNDSDLVVIYTDADNVDQELVLNTDYTVTEAGHPDGGKVKLQSGGVLTSTTLTSSESLSILRSLPVTQLVDLRNQRSFFADTHEDVFDRLTILIQQELEVNERSLRIPQSINADDVDTELPKPDAGKAIAWNSSENGLINLKGPIFDNIKNTATVDSVSDLRTTTFPDDAMRLWLSGYYGVGTAGGGPLYRDSVDTTTADNGGTVFVDADGVRWKAGAGFVVASDVTINIPSDYATLQEAIDYLSQVGVTQGAIIDLVIESGHQPASGVDVDNGDYGHFQISSVDAEVTLDATFSGRFVNAAYSNAPVLNCLVDAASTAERGYVLLISRGYVTAGSGVKNVTNEALWAYHSIVNADEGVWSGAGTYAMRMSRGTIFNASNSDCTGCTGGQNGIIYVNRGSIGNIQLTDVSNCQAEKILYCHRGSKLNAHNLTADGCVIDSSTLSAFAVANRVSELDINSSDVTNLDGPFVFATSASSVNCKNMNQAVTAVAGGSHNGIEANQGSVIACVSTTLDGFGNHGIYCVGSKIIANSATVQNSGNRGIYCEDLGAVSAPGITITGSGERGVVGNKSAHINVRAGSVTGSTGDDLEVLSGSFINAEGTSTTNGTGSPDSADTSPSTFNSLSGRGVIWV